MSNIGARTADSLFDSTIPEHHELVMITLIKICDISNVFREPALANKWMTRITDEYYAQGDQMLARDMSPVPDMMNRNSGTSAQETTVSRRVCCSLDVAHVIHTHSVSSFSTL